MTINEIETPCFIIRNKALQEGITGFKKSLNKYFPSNILAYSIKANALPYILETATQSGAFVEVVSVDEYELVRLLGIQKEKVIYNGFLKDKETFLQAITDGAIVNIETQKEIDWLSELPEEHQYKVGIRMNIDLNAFAREEAIDNESFSRFGFSSENGELQKAIERIHQYPNVKVNGVHAHRTTTARSVDFYKRMAQYVCKTIQSISLHIDYLDVGGGFFGIMEGKPTFNDYCEVIAESIKPYYDLNQLTLIVEPGNAIAAASLDFLSEVIDIKLFQDFCIATIDGSRNDIDPFFKKTDYFKSFIFKNTSASQREIAAKQIIGGGTCLEYDKLFEIKNEARLEIGDRIIFKSVGAYTMILSPLFIRFFPKVYLEENGDYTLVRREWRAKDLLSIHYASTI